RKRHRITTTHGIARYPAAVDPATNDENIVDSIAHTQSPNRRPMRALSRSGTGEAPGVFISPPKPQAIAIPPLPQQRFITLSDRLSCTLPRANYDAIETMM
ncbi:hypothetical protein FHT93_004936, partial [Rhizobium sp. BK379]|nr:hypothetical protein [Rhizobium sp. BK379]